MRTIATCVEEILVSQPFLEDALTRNILNYSALSEELLEPISKMLRKPVKAGAIMMALRRYDSPANVGNAVRLKQIFNNLGDITVRSNLSDFTFQNSKTLIHSHSKVLEKINTNQQLFYAFTRGIFESNIMSSTSEKESIFEVFKNENLIGLQDNLSAISINLPQGNSKIAGLYYQIFKRLAFFSLFHRVPHPILYPYLGYPILQMPINHVFRILRHGKSKL